MHTCPRCGYEPLPEAITTPEVYPSSWLKGKWTVRCWTNESDHSWIKEFNTKEEAEAKAALIQAAREKAIKESEEDYE